MSFFHIIDAASQGRVQIVVWCVALVEKSVGQDYYWCAAQSIGMSSTQSFKIWMPRNKDKLVNVLTDSLWRIR